MSSWSEDGTNNYLPPLSELQLGVVLDHGLDLLGQSIPSLQEDRQGGG
jgi:hypothetical protein